MASTIQRPKGAWRVGETVGAPGDIKNIGKGLGQGERGTDTTRIGRKLSQGLSFGLGS